MRRAFTAIELAMVLVIMVILAAMLVPALQRGRGQAERTKCLSRVRQIGMAITMYETAYAGAWPAARRSVAPDHPDWPDPTGSLAALYPRYAPEVYLFQCPATADIVSIAPDGKDFLNCANFHVSPTGRATQPEDAGKGTPRPPSFFYDCGTLFHPGIPRNAAPSRVAYGDDCVHGYYENDSGRGFWLGRNNHPLDGGNFLFVDKHVDWLPVRWYGRPWQMGRAEPFVPNFHVRIPVSDTQGARFAVGPDTNVFWDDYEGKHPDADADLSGMMWVDDSWLEF